MAPADRDEPADRALLRTALLKCSLGPREQQQRAGIANKEAVTLPCFFMPLLAILNGEGQQCLVFNNNN